MCSERLHVCEDRWVPYPSEAEPTRLPMAERAMAERAARDEERGSRIRSGGSSSAPSPGILLAISGPYAERNFQIPAAGGLIGRSRKCTLSLLHDCEVSHNHALLEVVRGHLCIRDVGSTFGTYLNDKRLSEPKRASEAHKLKPCDCIKVGQTCLRWRPAQVLRSSLDVSVPREPMPLTEVGSTVRARASAGPAAPGPTQLSFVARLLSSEGRAAGPDSLSRMLLALKTFEAQHVDAVAALRKAPSKPLCCR